MQSIVVAEFARKLTSSSRKHPAHMCALSDSFVAERGFEGILKSQAEDELKEPCHDPIFDGIKNSRTASGAYYRFAMQSSVRSNSYRFIT